MSEFIAGSDRYWEGIPYNGATTRELRAKTASRSSMRRYLPTKDQLRNTRSLKFLGEVIFEPNLWHFNRHSLAYAVLVGSVCCFLPIPFQMVPCILTCIWVRCNVPVAVLVVWISNPITFAPMMYFAYRVGTTMLDIEYHADAFTDSSEITNQVMLILQPLLIGCLVSGFTMGIIGFIGVRLYYRWKIARYLQRRQRKKEQRLAARRAAATRSEES